MRVRKALRNLWKEIETIIRPAILSTASDEERHPVTAADCASFLTDGERTAGDRMRTGSFVLDEEAVTAYVQSSWRKNMTAMAEPDSFTVPVGM